MYIVFDLFIQNSINVLILLTIRYSFTYKTCVLGSLINLVEVLALVVLPAHLLLLVDVRQEVADMLELRAFGRHACPRRLGAQPLGPGVANSFVTMLALSYYCYCRIHEHTRKNAITCLLIVL